MKIAVCQFPAGIDVAANTALCMTAISDAARAGADLAVLPEASMYFDPRHEDLSGGHGQSLDGPFAKAIRDAAAAAGIAVLVGMLEVADGDAQGDTPGLASADSRNYNTLLAVSASGEVLGSYRKIHLYDAFGYRESDDYLPGGIAEPLIFTVDGVRVGALTCYDLRFPEAFRWVLDAGADVVALPSAWIVGPAKERHWHTLVAARAIENTVYVAASDQTGPVSCGQSIVVDPMGTVLAGAGEQPGIATAEISLARIASVRQTNPSVANRRFGIIARR